MPSTAPDPAAPFQFRCLGPVTLTGAGGTRHAFRTRKQTGLLLLLARHAGQPRGRDHLVEMLWSGDDPRAARHSLAQSISLINKTLGTDAIAFAGKDQVCLREGVVWLDVDAFEAAVAERRCDDARALWRGTLMEGLWIRRAPQFDAWLETERLRLQRAHREVLHEAVAAERTAGDWPAMRRTADALLLSDPLDEAAMLAYLEALTLGGDRTLALRRYGEFEVRLREELDAEPGAALRKWVKRYRTGEQAPAPAMPARVSETIVLPASRPLFGREAEFTSLWDGWMAAQRGAGSFVILEGPAGIGKSALAGKLANQAHVGGGSVCFARCYRTEKSVPFAPVTALLRQLMRLPGFVALGEVWIGELSRLVPELKERYPSAPAPMAIDDSARHRICDATLQAAECVADEQPLLIVVDDIQNADEATLALLHYFGRQTVGQPTLLLCVARAGAAESELERTFFETARSAGIARFLELGALGPEQSSRIARQVLAQRGLEAPDWVVSRLHEIAEGNPLQIIEAAMALPARETLTLTEWLDGVRAKLGNASFEQTSADRLGTLSAAARQVAAVLAAAGRPLSDYELAVVGGLPTTELASAVSELEDAEFVRRSGGSLAFTHERYLAGAAEQAEQSAHQQFSLRLAHLLDRSAAENPAARHEVARLFEVAGKPEQAREQALLAARHAASIGAINERSLALRLAVRLSTKPDWRTNVDLARCLVTIKDLDGALALCSEALAAEGVPPDLLAEFKLVAINADHNKGLVGLSATRDRLRALLATTGAGFACRRDAQHLLLRAADKSGDALMARRFARQARREASEQADEAAQAFILALTGFIAVKYYWPRRALPLFESAVAGAQAVKDWDLEQWARQGLGVALVQTGRYRDSIKHIDHAIALSRKLLDPFSEAMNLSDRSCTEMALGDFEAASASLAASHAIRAKHPSWPLRVYPIVNSATLDLLRRDYIGAARGFEEGYEMSARLGFWSSKVFASSGRAVCAARLGNNSELARWTEIAIDLNKQHDRTLPDRAHFEIALAWHTYLNRQNPELALRRLDASIRELARRNIDHWLRLELERVLLLEHSSKERDSVGRERVAALAGRYDARAVIRDAML